VAINKNSKGNVRVLCKYFGWAEMMKGHFQKEMEVPTDAIIGSRNNSKALVYMAVWYYMLSTIIEGWKKGTLDHNPINELLKSPHVTSLKKYQQKVLNLNLTNHKKTDKALLFEGLNHMPWANKIHEKIGVQLRKYLWNA
jgi:hypothetical protein